MLLGYFIISTFAGTGGYGDSGDGQFATSAEFKEPIAVNVISHTGDVYVGDRNAYKIRKIDGSTSIISTIAGTGESGLSGDGGSALAAKINLPKLCVDSITGDIYFTEYHYHRVRKITFATGIISTIAGTGSWGYNCDNCAALSSRLYKPCGISFNSITKDLFIADHYNHRIRKINSGGIISTVAGTGIAVISYHFAFQLIIII